MCHPTIEIFQLEQLFLYIINVFFLFSGQRNNFVDGVMESMFQDNLKKGENLPLIALSAVLLSSEFCFGLVIHPSG